MESLLNKTTDKGLRLLLEQTVRDPFKTSLLATILVSSILSLISSVNGAFVISFALESQAWIWYSSLLVASALALYGTYSQKLVRGLLIERFGMTWIAAIFLSYAIGLFFIDPQGRISPVMITMFVSLASVTRAVQITIDLKKLVR